MSPEEARIGMLTLFGREPSETEHKDLQRMTLPELRARAFASRSFAQHVLLGYFSADPNKNILHNTTRFRTYLDESGPAEIARVRGIIDQLPRAEDGSGHDYVGFHAKRMEELLLFLVRRNQHTPIHSILDVGLSPFIKAYKQVIPQVQVTLADIWLHPAEKLSDFGIDSFVRTDLNKTGVSREHGGAGDGRYDAIVFTEVIEHLLVDPVEAIADFLSMLNPGGFLFISTPNYFSYGAVLKILEKTNPQPRYARKLGNDDTHYHLREYSLKEMLEAADQCGAQTLFFALSDCWDRNHVGDERSARLPIALRSNLVLVLGNAAPGTGKAGAAP